MNFYSPGDAYLGGACLYNLWRARKTDEPLVTMTFLMRPACDYVMDHGHHRQPFLIHPGAFDEWMAAGDRDLKESVKILRDAAYEPQLAYEVIREMAPSWRSRQKGRLKQRDQQLAEIEKSGRALGIW